MNVLEWFKVKRFISDIKIRYPNLIIDYEYVGSKKYGFINIWHNNKELEQDQDFSAYIGFLMGKHFYKCGLKIYNVCFGYDYEKVI